jgi:hypothetical protein
VVTGNAIVKASRGSGGAHHAGLAFGLVAVHDASGLAQHVGHVEIGALLASVAAFLGEGVADGTGIDVAGINSKIDVRVGFALSTATTGGKCQGTKSAKN